MDEVILPLNCLGDGSPKQETHTHAPLTPCTFIITNFC